MKSYLEIIERVKNFYSTHTQVKRVGCDFEEQLDNFTAQNEQYPLIYISLLGTSTLEYLTTFSLEIKCLDLIRKDRVNINEIVSTTHLCLQDLYVYLRDADEPFDVLTGMQTTPLNNVYCDYLAGNSMLVDVEVEAMTFCDVPNDSELVEFSPIAVDEVEIIGGNNIILTWQ
jgi:hypothetical protein